MRIEYVTKPLLVIIPREELSDMEHVGNLFRDKTLPFSDPRFVNTVEYSRQQDVTKEVLLEAIKHRPFINQKESVPVHRLIEDVYHNYFAYGDIKYKDMPYIIGIHDKLPKWKNNFTDKEEQEWIDTIAQEITIYDFINPDAKFGAGEYFGLKGNVLVGINGQSDHCLKVNQVMWGAIYPGTPIIVNGMYLRDFSQYVELLLEDYADDYVASGVRYEIVGKIFNH